MFDALAGLAYGPVFDARGRLYQAAMQRAPQARRAEFDALFADAAVQPGQRVLDVPAGGGYLGSFLAGAQVVGQEFSAGFGGGVPVVTPDGPWGAEAAAPFDHAVCLAALHHVTDPLALAARLMSLLRPGGVLHLADVAAGSAQAQFLETFVHAHTATGHRGQYCRADDGRWAALGVVRRQRMVATPWHFASEGEMVAFCGDLFGLDADGRGQLPQALGRTVGLSHAGGGCQVHWALWYVDVHRPAGAEVLLHE